MSRTYPEVAEDTHLRAERLGIDTRDFGPDELKEPTVKTLDAIGNSSSAPDLGPGGPSGPGL